MRGRAEDARGPPANARRATRGGARDWAASGVFLLPILSRVRHVHRGPTDVSAVPSHGRRVHTEARTRVVLAVSRAASPLKRGPARRDNVDVSDAPYRAVTIPP